MTPTIQLRPLHAAQAQIRREARRFNVVSCGRRFGKTDFGLDEAIDGPRGLLDGCPVGWFAPNARYFEEAWIAAQRILAPLQPAKQEQKKRLTLPTGAVLEFWDLEDPDSGRSRAYGKVIIDEAAKIPRLEQAWEQAISPTLIDFGGNAWFLSSPKGHNYFHQLHERGNPKSARRRDDWASWIFPSSANPHVRPEEIERIAAEMPELVRRQEIEGQFVDLSGASVHRDWLKYGELPQFQTATVAMGVDLAISLADHAAYSAVVVIARTSGGRVYVLFVKRFRLPFAAILEQIRRIAADWNPTMIGIESNQFQAAVVQELLRTTSLPVRGVQVTKDKLTRFQPVLARYEQGLVIHTPGLPPEFEEELLAFPMGVFKDMCDAFGLAYQVCPDPSKGADIILGSPRADFSTLALSEEELETADMFAEHRW